MDPRAQSDVGAQGLMQIMPETQKELGITDPFDPAQSIDKGSAYLRRTIDHFDGDVEKGIAAYHSGMGNVKKWEDRYGDDWKKGLGPQGAKYTEELAGKYESAAAEDLRISTDKEESSRRDLYEQYPDRLKPKQVQEEIQKAAAMAEYNASLSDHGGPMADDMPMFAQINQHPREAAAVKMSEFIQSGKYTPMELGITQEDYDMRKRSTADEVTPEQKQMELDKASYLATATLMGYRTADEQFPEVAAQIAKDEEEAAALKAQEAAERAADPMAKDAPDDTIWNWTKHTGNVFVEGIGATWDGLVLSGGAAAERQGAENALFGEAILERASEEYSDLHEKNKRLLQSEAERRGMSVSEMTKHNANKFIESAMEEADTLTEINERYKDMQEFAAVVAAIDATVAA